QRPGPLLFGLGSVLIGLALLLATHAPRELVALIVASFAGGAGATGINRFLESGIHAGVGGAARCVLVLIAGPALLAGVVGVAAVGWSRVRLRDHTVAQVIVGAAI